MIVVKEEPVTPEPVTGLILEEIQETLEEIRENQAPPETPVIPTPPSPPEVTKEEMMELKKELSEIKSLLEEFLTEEEINPEVTQIVVPDVEVPTEKLVPAKGAQKDERNWLARFLLGD